MNGAEEEHPEIVQTIEDYVWYKVSIFPAFHRKENQLTRIMASSIFQFMTTACWIVVLFCDRVFLVHCMFIHFCNLFSHRWFFPPYLVSVIFSDCC